LGLVKPRLERPGVDLKQELALLDERTLLISLLQQVACDLCPDVGIGEAIERANPFSIDRNILLLNLNDFDGRRRNGRRS